jgi:predicted GNAT family acetyltransferase
MSSSPATPEIVDVTRESRFVATMDRAEAELVYEIDAGRLILVHTGVPDELSGHGLGGKLVRAALDKAEREELTLVPLCPFARRWLREHPHEQGPPIDWQLPRTAG